MPLPGRQSRYFTTTHSLSPFIYTANNPIKFVDIKDLAHGDAFQTKREAALDWGKYYNKTSIRKHKEFASTIYEVKISLNSKLHIIMRYFYLLLFSSIISCSQISDKSVLNRITIDLDQYKEVHGFYPNTLSEISQKDMGSIKGLFYTTDSANYILGYSRKGKCRYYYSDSREWEDVIRMFENKDSEGRPSIITFKYDSTLQRQYLDEYDSRRNGLVHIGKPVNTAQEAFDMAIPLIGEGTPQTISINLYNDEIWLIYAQPLEETFGGDIYIEIRKEDGKILKVIRGE